MVATKPVPSTPADPRNPEALDRRVMLANERTFLAWNRTALALIAGGLAVSQLAKRSTSSVTLIAALALIAFGALTSLAGYEHWRRNDVAIRLGESVDYSRLTRFLSYGIAAFAITAAALAVIKLMP